MIRAKACRGTLVPPLLCADLVTIQLADNTPAAHWFFLLQSVFRRAILRNRA